MKPQVVMENVMITRVYQGDDYINPETGVKYPAKTYIDTKDVDDRGARVQEWAIADVKPEQFENVYMLPCDIQADISFRTYERNTRVELSNIHIQVRGAPDKKKATGNEQQR